MFPDFNIFSIPLLILIIQGLILVGMLIRKSRVKKDTSSLILAILLLLTCYHRSRYTIGFMDWYDTYRNTKINYYLISLVLGVGPLIYLYIKSVGEKAFELNKSNLLHFVPLLIYVFSCVGLLIYDSSQVDFDLTQNGILMQWMLEYLIFVISLLFSLHLLLYLILSFRFYYKVRSRLEHQFSDTYKFELVWLRNFLFLFTFLFIYDIVQVITDGLISDLHWTQEWWYEFFSLLVVIYVGVKGYFTQVEDLPLLDSEILYAESKEKPTNEEASINLQDQSELVLKVLEEEKLYLDSDLSLTKLARKLKIPSSQLSMVINKGLNQNFNELINVYRVKSIKEKLISSENDHLSILAIALDSGFNSKATFNRVFKKIDGKAPSFYRNKK